MPKKRQMSKEQDKEEIEQILAEITQQKGLRENPEDDMPEFPEEIAEPDDVEDTHKEEEPLCIEDYINLPPDMTDITFERSGELVDLKILKENLYLQEKKSYVVLMLVGLIFFAMGVI